jgi:hypothetical protein
MRKALLILAAALVGCGSSSDSSTAPAASAQVQWKVDGASCTGSATVLFFVDGTQIGQAVLAAGGSPSGFFTVTVAQHTLGARTSTNSVVWPSTTVTFTANEQFTQVLTC